MGTRRIISSEGRVYTLFFRKVSPFSNHFPIEFSSDLAINCTGQLIRFSCNEQFYMFNKASLFGDEIAMNDILKSNNPKQMKQIASLGKIQNWNEEVWNSKKDEVMRNGTMAKFRQVQHLRFVLFLSIGSELVECSPFDRYWGIEVF